MQIQSLCDVFDCETCGFRERQTCPGCVPGNERLAALGKDVCAIYTCVTGQGIRSCAACEREACPLEHRADKTCPLRSTFESKRRWAGKIAKRLCDQVRRLRALHPSRRVSDRTVTRLHWYLVALEELAAKGSTSVSSRELADSVGVNAALVRKDLSYFGEFGTPSFGYNVRYLQRKITEILHLNEQRNIMWIGAKRLMENASLLKELPQHNCHIVAVLDSDGSLVGVRINGLQVLHLSSLGQVVENLGADAAVVAVPSPEAQRVADALVAAGVKALLNLTSVRLQVPGDVTVRNVDVAGELMALSFYTGEHPKESRTQQAG